jgi:hypothetical protein
MKTQTQIDLRPLTKAAALRELDETFESDANKRTGKLDAEEYFARRGEIEKWADIPAPKPIEPAPAKPSGVITWKTIEHVVERIGHESALLITERLAPIEKQNAQVADAIAAVTAAIEALDKRLSDAESAEALAELKKVASTLTSLERRLSRHGEHLARLESRTKTLEHER